MYNASITFWLLSFVFDEIQQFDNINDSMQIKI